MAEALECCADWIVRVFDLLGHAFHDWIEDKSTHAPNRPHTLLRTTYGREFGLDKIVSVTLSNSPLMGAHPRRQ